MVSREVLTKRHNVLDSMKRLRSSVEGHKPDAYGLKNTLDCIEQEWGIQSMRQTTYTMRRISIELHRTREKDVSNQEHVTDVIESVRRRSCPQIGIKVVSENE